MAARMSVVFKNFKIGFADEAIRKIRNNLWFAQVYGEFIKAE